MLVSNLTGCASLDFFKSEEPVDPIQITTKPADKTRLDLELPDSLKLKPINWVLVTPGNQEEVFKKLETDGTEMVVFGLTSDGYQQLALTISELRNLINTQRNIIIKYKEYYEPKQEETKK